MGKYGHMCGGDMLGQTAMTFHYVIKQCLGLTAAMSKSESDFIVNSTIHTGHTGGEIPILMSS